MNFPTTPTVPIAPAAPPAPELPKQPWDSFINKATITYGQSQLGQPQTGMSKANSPTLGTPLASGFSSPLTRLNSDIGYRQAGMERKREMEQGLSRQMRGSLRY
jgi:hypothetical protein